MEKIILRTGMAAPPPLLAIARKISKNGAGVTIEHIDVVPMKLIVVCNLENITQEEAEAMKKNEAYLGVSIMDGVPFFVARLGKTSFDVVLQDLPEVSSPAIALICVVDPADEYRIRYVKKVDLPPYLIREINRGVAPIRDLHKNKLNEIARGALSKYSPSDVTRSGLFYAIKAKTPVIFA